MCDQEFFLKILNELVNEELENVNSGKITEKTFEEVLKEKLREIKNK
jgi:hypothetical protein